MTYLRGLHLFVAVFVHLREEVWRHLVVPDEHVAFGKSFLHVNQLDVKNQHGTAWNLISWTHK